MGKYTQEIENLDTAISMDQAYVCRDILVGLDKVANKDSEVSAYYRDNAEKLDLVRADIAYVTELLTELNSQDSWTLCKTASHNTKIYFKKEEGSPFLMTKAETLMEGSLEELPKLFVNLVSLFNETDLMPKWYPLGLMKSHETVVSPTPFTKATWVKIKLPFPASTVFGPRDCIIRAKGFDLSERMSSVISVQPLEVGEVFHGFEVPAPDDGWTRITLKATYMFEMSPDGIIFKQMQLLDLKSKIIPTPLMNWLAKGELPLKFLARIRNRLAKHEGSIWEERIKADTRLYSDVENRLVMAVEKNFGVQAVALNSEETQMKRKKSRGRFSSKNALKRLSSLTGRKKDKNKEDAQVVEEQQSVLAQAETAPVVQEEVEQENEEDNPFTKILEQVQATASDLLEKFTTALGINEETQ